jgi:acyl carrier protein
VQPDFVVLCTGLLAAAGGLGQVNNAAAAAFLDALAQKHRSGGGPALVSIAWDESSGEEIAPGEAGECLARALELSLPQVIVSPYDPSTVVARSLARAAKASAAPAAGDEVQPRRAVAIPYVPPGNPVEQQIADLWEELLGIERVGVNDDFYELGGHSLTATQLVSRLRDLFEVTVPVQQFLAEPTVASLAEKVVQHQAERLDGNTLAQMLSEIQQLSPEELKTLLKAE